MSDHGGQSNGEAGSTRDLELGSRGVLDPGSPPPLWPLLESGPLGYRYASTNSGLHFICESDRFTIQHRNAWRHKVLTAKATTEQGWSDIWRVMVTRYPDLARTVAETVWKDYEPVARREALVKGLSTDSLVETLTNCVLLGGYGLGDKATPGEPCTLFFGVDGLAIAGDRALFEIRSPYSRSRELEFTGPGVVKRGGGFIGGGFGLTAAAEGMIVASVLNSLTTRMKVHTIIRYQAIELEAFFFHSVETPDQLRIRLSGVLGRIRSGKEVTPERDSKDRLSELERLGKLYGDGVLSADEFAEMKRQIIEGR